MTVSSWSWPVADCPFRASTPSTTNGWLLMRIVSPVGSAFSPNSWSRTSAPSSATFAERLTSASEKNAPDSMSQSRIVASSALAPWIVVDQLPDADTTWARVVAPGDMAATPGRAAIASASAGVSVVRPP